jgi:hypothetical protein
LSEVNPTLYELRDGDHVVACALHDRSLATHVYTQAQAVAMLRAAASAAVLRR